MLAARTRTTVKVWKARALDERNPYCVGLDVQDLIPLITDKTRLVGFTACSNILGSILPVKEITRAIRDAAREKGARKVEICLDCVAYAPHKRMDVQDWDVDYAVCSFYKVIFLS
jgi:selenocysteine lyase/cysteine desulfurase